MFKNIFKVSFSLLLAISPLLGFAKDSNVEQEVETLKSGLRQLQDKAGEKIISDQTISNTKKAQVIRQLNKLLTNVSSESQEIDAK